MKKAMEQARKAEQIGEVPIGAVIVKDGVILARGYNKRELKQDATCHAEITAIQKACKKLGNWRLVGCTLYVTLEPCAMCAGAIINARISRLIFGAFDPNSGACGSAMNVMEKPTLNHQVSVTGGILEEDASLLIKNFFRKRRTIK